MKQFTLFLLCAALCIVLFGCASSMAADVGNDPAAATEESTLPETTEPQETAPHVLPADYKFPVGTKIFGLHVGYMTPSQTCAAIAEVLDTYVLTATINGRAVTLTGGSLELACVEDAVTAYAVALDSGESTRDIHLVRYNESLLKRRISAVITTPAENASIIYNTETELFELQEGAAGTAVNMNTVMQMLDSAICAQRSEITIQVTEDVVAPQISADSAEAKAALDKANTSLNTQIVYDFILDDGSIHSEWISKETILSMLRFDRGLYVYIDSETLQEYVSEINTLYGYRGVEGPIKTTSGLETDLTVTYYAQNLDMDAFYDDIRVCLENGVSGVRIAPCLDELEMPEMPFHGDYIEVDITNQSLWLYRNGECLLTTPIVTGAVASYMRTPTGVYSVQRKNIGVNLVGPDYETYVTYWMPFRGGYGLHDAYWRSDFGGNIYLFGGSHGCVNIPPANAKFLYNNIYVGIPVVLYGGATNDGPLEREIIGTTSYDVTPYTLPFQLDAKIEFAVGDLAYTSSDPSVATVSEDGTVTIHRTGRTIIQVVNEPSRYYSGDTLEVEINVTDPCGDNHTFGPWNRTKIATCAEGEETRICGICSKTETRPLPAKDNHAYGAWTVTVEPGCEEGEEIKTCIVCGHTSTRVLAPIHKLGKWKETAEATCETDGEEICSCKNCDYTITMVIPALGHDFSDEEEFCGNDCGTKNPNYIPPVSEEEEP